MNTFWDVFWERREELLKLFVEHMEMTSTAVLVSLIVGVIIGIAITKNKTAASIVIGIANLMQSIPSIGLLAFMVPFVGIGQKPAIIMIVIYALLPIIKNTYTGITGIDPKLLEAARGMATPVASAASYSSSLHHGRYPNFCCYSSWHRHHCGICWRRRLGLDDQPGA